MEGGGGGKRKFLRDGDEVVFTGKARKEGLGYGRLGLASVVVRSCRQWKIRIGFELRVC